MSQWPARDRLVDATAARFASRSLAAGAFAVCCVEAFVSQSNTFLVATHGAVLGAAFAGRPAELAHVVALMGAVALEWIVFQANVDFAFNFINSLIVTAHLFFAFMWRFSAPQYAHETKRRGMRERLRWMTDAAVQVAVPLMCAFVDAVLAPHVGFFALKPGETTAFTFVVAATVARALPHLHLCHHQTDHFLVTAFVAIIVLACAVVETVQRWYVQCVFAWIALAIVLAHAFVSRLTADAPAAAASD